MPGKGIILVHSDEDNELLDSVMEHLGVLETVTKLETKTIESLDRLGTVALKKKLKGREALVLLLSAPVLSSKFLRHNVVKELAENDGLLLLMGRTCAWRIVPWLTDRPVWPENGCLTDIHGRELDQDMTELVYSLAEKLHLTQPDEVEDEEPSDIQEETEDTALDEAEDISLTPAAGPAEEELPQADTVVEDSQAGEDLDNDLTGQFDSTCASVLPEGTQLDDEILSALLELGLILGSTQEDAGEETLARHTYLHAARKLVDLINSSLVDGRAISPFVRKVRLAMWRSLKEAEGGEADINLLRAAFEESIDPAATT